MTTAKQRISKKFRVYVEGKQCCVSLKSRRGNQFGDQTIGYYPLANMDAILEVLDGLTLPPLNGLNQPSKPFVDARRKFVQDALSHLK